MKAQVLTNAAAGENVTVLIYPAMVKAEIPAYCLKQRIDNPAAAAHEAAQEEEKADDKEELKEDGLAETEIPVETAAGTASESKHHQRKSSRLQQVSSLRLSGKAVARDMADFYRLAACWQIHMKSVVLSPNEIQNHQVKLKSITLLKDF